MHTLHYLDEIGATGLLPTERWPSSSTGSAAPTRRGTRSVRLAVVAALHAAPSVLVRVRGAPQPDAAHRLEVLAPRQVHRDGAAVAVGRTSRSPIAFLLLIAPERRADILPHGRRRRSVLRDLGPIVSQAESLRRSNVWSRDLVRAASKIIDWGP
ncbi:hypothetical protein ACTIVE_1622 [Actinomadura verrucosospora]|uniref:Uncharacterized protein n=1 Tax=Actinomadura verrucosospora TaxID=46165 RepID=A0A7D3ZVJ3_ACTVE|nr:hypothetical protein ACTIVE_1622 [Actinomadura verrucosospora]